ncbi:MAG: protein kinase [Nibricoccus sp.]
MPISSRCPRCGSDVSTDAVQGLCPRCLLSINLATQTEGVTRPGNVPTEPPSLQEVAGYFPQLEILRLIGRGGMGAVYQARQPGLDRFVALKLLTPPQVDVHGFAERFTREARALARLNHANIVAVHDFGERQGHYYLLMEFVDGVNLRELLQQKTITPAQALAIVPKVCEALQFAHEQGVVHRDIKPENILLDKRGQVKIADFGIAKIINSNAAPSYLTGAQDRMGTPHYMAPEQVESSKSVDHRADIYSLGVVFYELLTGELPLGRFSPPSQKVQIDVRLDEVVLRALEKEPDRRFQHAAEVKTQVDTIVATPGESVKKPRAAARHWPWIVATALFALTALVATTILLLRPKPIGINNPGPVGSYTLDNAPPVVVSTWPVSGVTDVESGEIELRVTFSKPMQQGCSWVTVSGLPYPEASARPAFSQDRLTCTYKVKVQPGKTYGTMINSRKYTNFKDLNGTPAVPYLLTFATQPAATSTTSPGPEPPKPSG